MKSNLNLFTRNPKDSPQANQLRNVLSAINNTIVQMKALDQIYEIPPMEKFFFVILKKEFDNYQDKLLKERSKNENRKYRR